MKTLKWILYIILIIVALFLVVALFLPTAYNIERTIVINKPVETVYQYVLDFSKRAEWDPWIQNQPDATTDIAGPEKGVGAKWIWEGDEIGTGSITIVETKPNELIQSELEFISPRPSKSTVTWKFEEVEGNTEVTWGFSGKLGYPIERFVGLRMDAMIGPDFERGLQNLKEAVENLPDEAETEMEE
ncbi:hypothetical protein GF337_07670 [candidate division KSB1 bacterium]|nr:hypothetical protein [candidate division KSB1 bacterium]